MNQSFKHKDDINDMEEQARFQIITVEDEEAQGSQAAKILADCKEAITVLYASFREWLKDANDNEEIKAKKAKLKQDSDKIIALAKEQLRKLQENEDLRKAVDKGVQVASDTGDWVMQTVSEFRRSENGQKVEAFVNSVKNDARVKQGVSTLKKGTLRAAEGALKGLRRVLDEKDGAQDDKAEVSENEKNNNL